MSEVQAEWHRVAASLAATHQKLSDLPSDVLAEQEPAVADEQRELSVDLLRRSVEQGDELERLAREAQEIARVAIGQRDALAAVIEEARGVARKFAATSDTGDYGWGKAKAGSALADILSRTPADVLVERDARIRAEVIDWIEDDNRGLANRAVSSARARFGLTEGADRG